MTKWIVIVVGTEIKQRSSTFMLGEKMAREGIHVTRERTDRSRLRDYLNMLP